MIIKPLQFFLICGLLFMSCNRSFERTEESYFDMEELVLQQIQTLNTLNPNINKKASINGVDEEKNRKLDSAEWVSEMTIFMEADINKPRLIGSYDKEEVLEGTDKTILYKAKDIDDVQVEFLKLIYQDDKLKRIESLYTERNILYITRRRLQMNFVEDNQGAPILSGYLINGRQKMIFKDTIQYNIESKILF